MVDKDIIKSVKRYLGALEPLGIHARQAILFGSFARGDAHEWSDIDLLVIAPEFDGPRELAMIKKLWHATIHTDNRIEPIPAGLREWQNDTSRPILEIVRREGFVIEA